MGFRFLAALLAILPLAATAAQAGERAKVLVVAAHPDDEIFIGPAIARLARDGGEVTILFATSGDQGPGVSAMEKGAALATHREGEARCSAAALGARHTIFLRHGDGTLGAPAHLPGSPARRLTADLGKVLRDGSYDIVLTWGPDGGYGHIDHRMVSAITTQLVQAISARPLLLYPGIRAGTLPPNPELADWAVTDPSLLLVDQAYAAQDLAAANAALQCHASQFDEASRAGMMTLFDQTIWQGAVHFRPALPKRSRSNAYFGLASAFTRSNR